MLILDLMIPDESERRMIERTEKISCFGKRNGMFFVFIGVLLAAVALAMFQDYLHSKRIDSSFVFFESLLFKAVWFLFPPILIYIKRILEQHSPNTITHYIITLFTATFAHLIIVPLIVWGISAVFKEQAYGVIKVLTFTLANDLVKILLVYTSFLALMKYTSIMKRREENQTSARQLQKAIQDCLTVSSGKETAVIKLKDILYIKSATPYVAIHIPEKQYLYSASLKSISETLDSRFVRVHRSIIVNLDKIISYQSRLNGDYDLTLEDNSQLRLSRNYVKGFKTHFELAPQLNS